MQRIFLAKATIATLCPFLALTLRKNFLSFDLFFLAGCPIGHEGFFLQYQIYCGPRLSDWSDVRLNQPPRFGYACPGPRPYACDSV